MGAYRDYIGLYWDTGKEKWKLLFNYVRFKDPGICIVGICGQQMCRQR